MCCANDMNLQMGSAQLFCSSCTDGVSNGDETGVDCGGSCERCPPPPPRHVPSPPPPSTGGASCTGQEFLARTAAISAACCDDGAHPCVSGLPTTCTTACATVLLPMQRDYASMVTMMGLNDVIDTAAAECPATPCGTGIEFLAYKDMMTAACCNSSTECVAGIPTGK